MTKNEKSRLRIRRWGVKGIGLVGALTVAEEEGYKDWQRVAGTSAGAIVASLLAAGYGSQEKTHPKSHVWFQTTGERRV